MDSSIKKLLIVIPSYRWGGDSTALYNLLNKLDPAKFQVDLFPLLDEGPYRERYSNCNLLAGSPLIESLLRRFRPALNIRSIRAFILKTLNNLSNGRFTDYIYRKVGKKLIDNKINLSNLMLRNRSGCFNNSLFPTL